MLICYGGELWCLRKACKLKDAASAINRALIIFWQVWQGKYINPFILKLGTLIFGAMPVDIFGVNLACVHFTGFAGKFIPYILEL